MPLRYIASLPTPALCPAPLLIGVHPNSHRFRRHLQQQQQQQHPQHLFHTTRCLRDDEIDRATNHYEALKLPTNASPADIKRSFYTLSKTHHPDHNRSDPAASQRFMRIREAYTTLSSPERRTRYDRDVLHLHHHHHPGRRGSYSSTNPAGGRPASGLSKRRTAFRGPPPSFYRSGGWGAHGAKRAEAHESSTGGAGGSGTSSSSSSHPEGGSESHRYSEGTWATGGAGASSSSSTAGGMGPGQDPFKGFQDDVPHFDREGHERTGRRTEERRTTRRRMRMDGRDSHVEAEQGVAGMFFVIGGILLTSFLVPLGIYRVFWGGAAKEPKKRARP